MLPQKSNLLDMSFSYNGQPFIDTTTKSIDLTKMEYSYNGQPFITNSSGSTPVVNTSNFFAIIFQL